jgi:hypothetical protein
MGARKRALAAMAALIVLAGAAAGTATGAASPRIVSCETFRTWFALQPANGVAALVAPAPKPRGPDELAIPFGGATAYRTNVGSGGCLSGWYDAVARRAAVLDEMSTYRQTSLFVVATAPAGIAARSLHPLATTRGVRIGATLFDVQRIEGRGAVAHVGSRVVLRYHWETAPNHLLHDLAFAFDHARVVAIVSGSGH